MLINKACIVSLDDFDVLENTGKFRHSPLGFALVSNHVIQMMTYICMSYLGPISFQNQIIKTIVLQVQDEGKI